MKIGQNFTSKSKIQTEPVSYIFAGMHDDGDHLLTHNSNDRLLDVKVDPKWYIQRIIRLED